MNLIEIIETYCHLRQQDEVTRAELAEDYLIGVLEEKFSEDVFKKMLVKKDCKVSKLIADLLHANDVKNFPMLRIFLPVIRECYVNKKAQKS